MLYININVRVRNAKYLLLCSQFFKFNRNVMA